MLSDRNKNTRGGSECCQERGAEHVIKDECRERVDGTRKATTRRRKDSSAYYIFTTALVLQVLKVPTTYQLLKIE